MYERFNRWYYFKKQTDSLSNVTDSELVKCLVNSLFNRAMPTGDGKFSRAQTYVEKMREEIATVRRAWNGSNDELSAFLMGVEVSFEVFSDCLEKIKRG